jgi:hypothetical protein
MLRIHILLLSLLILLSSSPSEHAGLSVRVLKKMHADQISSGSGISFINDTIYIVGDDVPWLYKLNKNYEVIDKVMLSGITEMADGRIPKSIKPDFECMDPFDQGSERKLLVLSSGSIKTTRDTAYSVSKNEGHFEKRNARTIYENIKSAAKMDADDEINIEGVAITDDKIYLLHRGNVSDNFIAAFSLQAFSYHLFDYADGFLLPEIYRFDLPTRNKLVSGFSGGCMIPGHEALLFVASLENTDNVIDDGAILGSYVGIIPLDSLANGSFMATLVKEGDKVLPIKLEGITIKSIHNNKLSACAVADNDNGTSEILELEINF